MSYNNSCVAMIQNPILIYIRFHCNKSKFLSYFFRLALLLISFSSDSTWLRSFFSVPGTISFFVPCYRPEFRFYFSFRVLVVNSVFIFLFRPWLWSAIVFLFSFMSVFFSIFFVGSCFCFFYYPLL
jgi:hypothetical protein